MQAKQWSTEHWEKVIADLDSWSIVKDEWDNKPEEYYAKLFAASEKMKILLLDIYQNTVSPLAVYSLIAEIMIEIGEFPKP